MHMASDTMILRAIGGFFHALMFSRVAYIGIVNTVQIALIVFGRVSK